MHLLQTGLWAVFANSLVHGFQFVSENSDVIYDPSFPVLQNLTEQQTTNGGSFWSSSFLTASNSHQYLLISHALISPFTSLVRSSILDITNTSNYYSNTTYVSIPNITQNGIFNITKDDFTYLSTTPDSFSKLYTSMSTPDYSYELSFNATSKALLNMGGNPFNFGTGDTVEIGLPACQSAGSLTMNGETVTIVPETSFTWYERQHGSGGPIGNWTWFQLHFPGSDIKASIWAIDTSEPAAGTQWRFASVRVGNETRLRPLTFIADYGRTFTSSASNVTYPLKWTLDFGYGEHLIVESVRDDQELAGARALQDFAYEGFVTAKGNFMGISEAFGVVELVRSVA